MKRVGLISLLLCISIVFFCACSQENISVKEGNYYLGNSNTYIKISNFDGNAENSDNMEGFIGVCKLQFFNYDFSYLDSIYNADTSKQFADNPCEFNFGKSDDGYYLYTNVYNNYETDDSIPLNFPIEYSPDDNTIIIFEERFVLKED